MAHFPKAVPYLRQKSAIFPPLFMTWPKVRYSDMTPKLPCYRQRRCLLLDRIPKRSQFKTCAQKPYSLDTDQNGQNRHPISGQNFVFHKREYSLPGK